MSRIELNDTVTDMMIKMSDGNPGAVTVMMQMLQEAENIDPQAIMGGVGAVLALDTHEIYGSNIWILYKDVCGGDLRKMIMLMRATQLGKFPHTRLQNLASDPRTEGLPDDEWKELDDYVCDQLEEFAKPEGKH